MLYVCREGCQVRELVSDFDEAMVKAVELSRDGNDYLVINKDGCVIATCMWTSNISREFFVF